MKTEAQILAALQMCQSSEREIAAPKPKLANHVAQDIFKWVLDQPNQFGELLDQARQLFAKRN